MRSEVQSLAIAESTIRIDKSMNTVVSLRLKLTRHQSNSVNFEHRLEQVSTTSVHHQLYFIVAWVFPEAVVVEISLIELDWTAFITKHEFVVRKETHLP